MWLHIPAGCESSVASAESADWTSASDSDLTSLASAIARSCTSRGSLRQPAYWLNAWRKGALAPLRFGRTFGTSPTSEEPTSSAAAFLAKTSAARAKERGSLEGSEADSGSTCWQPLCVWDAATSSLRTSERSLLGGWISFSDRLPKQGSMRSGAIYPSPSLAFPRSGSGGSSWPTPTSRDHKDGACQDQDVPTNALLGRSAARWDCPSTHPAPPTPQPGDGSSSGGRGSRQQFPTPRGQDSYERSNRKTVQAAHRGEAQMTLTRHIRGPDGDPKRLNPLFVEWLQGMPIGWTSLAPIGSERWETWRRLLKATLRSYTSGGA